MSVNKVILIGNVGRDPEVRYLDNNSRVANFSIATTERGYTLANGTQVPDRTEWHNIVVWRAQAEFVEKYVKKGASLYVEGKIRTRSYDDKTGVKRYVTEIFADSIQFVGARRDDNTNGNYAPQQQAQNTNPAPAAEPVIKAESFDNNPFAGAQDSDDSGLPF